MRRVLIAILAFVAIAAVLRPVAYACENWADTSMVIEGLYVDEGPAAGADRHQIRTVAQTFVVAGPPDVTTQTAGAFRYNPPVCAWGPNARFERPMSVGHRLLLWFWLAKLTLLIGLLLGLAVAAAVARMRGRTMGLVGVVVVALFAGAASLTLGIARHGFAWVYAPVPLSAYMFSRGRGAIEIARRVAVAQAQNLAERDRAQKQKKKEDPCTDSGGCRRSGRCAFIDGDCRPRGDADCEGSLDCQEVGRCVAVDGVCAATQEGCRKWSHCPATACVLKGDECVADADATPTSQEDCALECPRTGGCELVDGRCRPTMLSHCRRSEACTDHGLCNFDPSGPGGGRCVPKDALNQLKDSVFNTLYPNR